MGPFHIPWSTFGALLIVIAAFALALLWAAWDTARERRGGRR